MVVVEGPRCVKAGDVTHARAGGPAEVRAMAFTGVEEVEV